MTTKEKNDLRFEWAYFKRLGMTDLPFRKWAENTQKIILISNLKKQ